jgi:hypothetical protein
MELDGVRQQHDNPDARLIREVCNGFVETKTGSDKRWAGE